VDLPSLRTLLLEGNRLTSAGGIFDARTPLPRLRRLSLARNRLRRLRASPPELAAPRLARLSLRGNRLSSLAGGPFRALAALTALDLRGNEVRRRVTRRCAGRGSRPK
jgi:Leucine-rich repeat (LRR) protein